jgi:hypothetical protein
MILSPQWSLWVLLLGICCSQVNSSPKLEIEKPDATLESSTSVVSLSKRNDLIFDKIYDYIFKWNVATLDAYVLHRTNHDNPQDLWYAKWHIGSVTTKLLPSSVRRSFLYLLKHKPILHQTLLEDFLNLPEIVDIAQIQNDVNQPLNKDAIVSFGDLLDFRFTRLSNDGVTQSEILGKWLIKNSKNIKGTWNAWSPMDLHRYQDWVGYIGHFLHSHVGKRIWFLSEPFIQESLSDRFTQEMSSRIFVFRLIDEFEMWLKTNIYWNVPRHCKSLESAFMKLYIPRAFGVFRNEQIPYFLNLFLLKILEANKGLNKLSNEFINVAFLLSLSLRTDGIQILTLLVSEPFLYRQLQSLSSKMDSIERVVSPNIDMMKFKESVGHDMHWFLLNWEELTQELDSKIEERILDIILDASWETKEGFNAISQRIDNDDVAVIPHEMRFVPRLPQQAQLRIVPY